MSEPNTHTSSESTPKPEHKRLKIAIDITAIFAFSFLFIIIPILSHYYPNSREPNGDIAPLVKLTLIDIPLSFLSLCWLLIRYSSAIDKNFPIFLKLQKDVGLKIKLIFGALLLYLLGYLIIRNTLFVWIH